MTTKTDSTPRNVLPVNFKFFLVNMYNVILIVALPVGIGDVGNRGEFPAKAKGARDEAIWEAVSRCLVGLKVEHIRIISPGNSRTIGNN